MMMMNRLSRRTALLATAGAAVSLAADGPSPPKSGARTSLRVPFWPATGGVQIGDSPSAQLPPGTVVQAKVNGEAARIARLLGPADDLIILLVVDVSGDLSRVDPARDALNARLQELRPNVLVSLLRAQDGLRVLKDPTADRAAISGAIQELTVSGRAGLIDTVETALALADAMLIKAKVRVAVLYVSDSLVSNYREDFANPVVNSSDSRDMSRRFPEALIKERMQQVLARVGRTQTPLFVVQLSYENDRLNEAYQTGLIEVATATGGAAEFCRTLTEIPSTIETVIQRIAGHSSAEIEFAAAKSRQWDVELVAEGAEVRYRNRFLPKGGAKR